MIGKHVVVIGGRLHGCQTAEFLVDLGKRVTIVDTGTRDEIGDGLVEVFLKPYLLYWLEDHGVEFVTEVGCEEVTADGLWSARKDGSRALPARRHGHDRAAARPQPRGRDALRRTCARGGDIGDAPTRS